MGGLDWDGLGKGLVLEWSVCMSGRRKEMGGGEGVADG